MILIVRDLGDTREVEYSERAINLTTEILKHRSERALVLFKNYRDQRRANDYLSKVFSVDNEPQLRSPRNPHPSLPQETANQAREGRNSRTPSEIIMGNHTPATHAKRLNIGMYCI
jgi:hypothetical protein